MDYREPLNMYAHTAPLEPGVYMWYDHDGAIIYIGKAKILRQRLLNYFLTKKDVKTKALLSHASRIETIITSSEYEALLLEHTLIRKHRPRYNIALKYSAGYPVLRFTDEAFPRLIKSRTAQSGTFFGPFPSGVTSILTYAAQLPFRKCRTFHTRRSPCFYYHIHRCFAPCCGFISHEAYMRTVVQPVYTVLSQEPQDRIRTLTEQMHTAAQLLQFEQAALLRDIIRALSHYEVPTVTAGSDTVSRDYIAWCAEGLMVSFVVLSVRDGALAGRDLFRTQSVADETESLETFLMNYYTAGRPLPERIIIAEQSGTACARAAAVDADIALWFREQFGVVPFISEACEPGDRARSALARHNAEEDIRAALKARGFKPALEELQRVLSLTRRPDSIEGFDISHLNGRNPVASLVSFRNGQPYKKGYRLFKLTTVIGTSDDYAAMREVVLRRFRRLLRDHSDLPDLLLIDGGRGQVHAVTEVLENLNVCVDVVGLAKEHEALWTAQAEAPIMLSRRSEALKLLQSVRDEAHRKAHAFNELLRTQALHCAVLESIKGIGKRRAHRLLHQFRSLEAITHADPHHIAACIHVRIELAQTIQTTIASLNGDRPQANGDRPPVIGNKP
jgi:excinuclease ABC subunit C